MENVGDMGQLTPNATYIYERADGVTYAREVGADPSSRVVMGWEHRTGSSDMTFAEQVQEDQYWVQIRKAAKNNPALQDALDRVKILYELSKEPDIPSTVAHHPV